MDFGTRPGFGFGFGSTSAAQSPKAEEKATDNLNAPSAPSSSVNNIVSFFGSIPAVTPVKEEQKDKKSGSPTRSFGFGVPSTAQSLKAAGKATDNLNAPSATSSSVNNTASVFGSIPGVTLVKKEQKDKKSGSPFADALSTVILTEQKTDKPLTFSVALELRSWRKVNWTEEQKTTLMKTISSYRPSCEEATQTRVLLLGPIGSGKSSFISSVQSVFDGRVVNRAMVGSSSTASFTKKLQSFNIRGQKGEAPTSLVLCDTMGLGVAEMTGLTLHDILSVIKGHVPEGHKFRPDEPVREGTGGYVKWPSLKDKVHCVAFVVDASKLSTYPKSLSTTFQQLRDHISNLGVHQVALLTHVDKICQQTAKDITQVYKSLAVREMMGKAGALLGMCTSYIVPVKNYSSELNVDVNTDVLLLSAVDHILQYADIYYQDNTSQDTESVSISEA